MVKTLTFTKLNATGNDFILVDQTQEEERDWSQWAQILCQHRWGVGADGLLVISPSSKGAFRLRMWNPDGTEDTCGNGLRCALLYYAKRQGFRQRKFTVETRSGLAEGWVIDPGPPAQIQTLLPPPEFEPSRIPLKEEALVPPLLLPSKNPLQRIQLSVNGRCYPSAVLSVGTTHTVLFRSDPIPEEEFLEISPQIENHPLFPARTSVLWVWPKGDHWQARIWERGVGETLGCGTGACAIAVSAILTGSPSSEQIIESRGGILKVRWEGQGPISLIGDAQEVFQGSWPLE